MLDLSYMIQDMTTDINTKASEFKIIEDKKVLTRDEKIAIARKQMQQTVN